MNMVEVRAGNVEPDRLGAGRKQKRAVTQAAAVGELDCTLPGVDPRHARVQPDIDVVLLIEVRGPQQRPFLGRPAGQIILGQVGPVGGKRRIGAQHRDRPGIAFVAKRFGGHISGRAAADDHDGFGQLSRAECRPGLTLDPFPRIGNSVADLDAPAGQRVARRRTQDFAAAQVEAGMMPGAADRLADDHAFGERPAIMRAFGADGEQFIAAPDEDHGLIVDMALQHRSVGNRGKLHAKTEIGSFKLHIVGAHFILRSKSRRAIGAPMTPI